MASKPLQLGRPSRIPSSPDKAELDRLPNPHVDTVYVARFTAPEFTCLCPITGQPDFALLVIDYAPKPWLRIGGYWYPRGGIPIDVFWQTGKLPAGVWLPDQGVPPYRARG